MPATVVRAAGPDFARSEHLRPLARMARSGYARCSSSRPRRAARAAAAVREGRSSLRSMFVTWRWTVCSLTTSRSAIWRFVRPSVTRRSTSRSRGVSSASGAPASSPTDRSHLQPSRALRLRPRRRARGVDRGQFAASCSATSRATEGNERGGELDPRLRCLERPAASLEAIDRVLEQRPRPIVVAARRRHQPLDEVDGGPQGSACRRRVRSPAGPPAPRRASSSSPRAVRARASSSSPAARSSSRSAGTWRRQRSASSAARAASPRSSANRARQSCALEDGPARSSS